jgi:energy-coupling factor transporter ATP-binding protein EcfA2
MVRQTWVACTKYKYLNRQNTKPRLIIGAFLLIKWIGLNKKILFYLFFVRLKCYFCTITKSYSSIIYSIFMKINGFKATNIYGYINIDVTFEQDISYILGSNGSGKTTLLKLISALSTPSYSILNSIDFESLELELLNSNNKTATISLNKSNDNEYKISYTQQNHNSIEGVFTKFTYNNQMDFESNEEKKNLLESSFLEQEVVKNIKSAGSIIFTTFNSPNLAGSFLSKMRNNYIFKRRYNHFPLDNYINYNLIDSQECLYHLVESIEKHTQTIKLKKPIINQEFKNRILLNSFEFLEQHELDFIPDYDCLKNRREQAIEAFENFNLTGFLDHVNAFFDELENVQRNIFEVEKNNNKGQINFETLHLYQTWFQNQPQLKRINDIIHFNISYQKEIEKLNDPIHQIKSSVNVFLEAKKKRLDIDKNGKMTIHFNNGKIGSISEISDGEKRIISILINLIAISEKNKPKNSVFMLDEPETGLDKDWQKQLLKSMQELRPDNQFIIATNSKNMINKTNNYCIYSID